jgi:hypothetical protein
MRFPERIVFMKTLGSCICRKRKARDRQLFLSGVKLLALFSDYAQPVETDRLDKVTQPCLDPYSGKSAMHYLLRILLW